MPQYDLVDALNNRDYSTIKTCITEGQNPNSVSDIWRCHVHFSRCDHGETALEIAAEYGDADFVKLLLDKGAYVNPRSESGSTPLHNAVRFDRVEVVQILVEAGAQVWALNCGGLSAFETSFELKSVESVKLLLHAPMAIPFHDDLRSILDEGEYHEDKEIRYWFRARKHARSCATKTLINTVSRRPRGMDTEQENELFHAESRVIEMAKILVQSGANPFTVLAERSAFVEALCSGRHDFINRLQWTGDPEFTVALVNHQDITGQTALMRSVRLHDVYSTKVLIDSGADVHIADKKGNTALHHSIESYKVVDPSEESVIILLLNNGARADVLNKRGQSPLYLAHHAQYNHIFDVMLESIIK